MNDISQGLLEDLKKWGADERSSVTERIGQIQLANLLRWKLVRIVRIGSYELLTLGSRGRKHLGMGTYHPSAQGLLDRYIRRLVITGLEREGWTYVSPASRIVDNMLDPQGRAYLVMVGFAKRIVNVSHGLRKATGKRVLLFHAYPSRLASLEKYGTEIRLLEPPRPLPKRRF